MMKTLIIWMLLAFTIIESCSSPTSQKFFNRESEFLDLCKIKGVLSDGDFVFVPPNNCIACVKRASKFLDQFEGNVCLFTMEGTGCPPSAKIANCVLYSYDECSFRGLELPYSIAVKIKDGKVCWYKAIVD